MVWEAKLEALEQLTAQFVKLSALSGQNHARRATKIWDLAKEIRDKADQFEEDLPCWVWAVWKIGLAR